MKSYKMTDEFEHEVKDNWLVYWWKRIWYEEYHLTIYFVANKTVDERGRETYTRTPKKYKASRIYTLKPNIIKFKDDDRVEFRWGVGGSDKKNSSSWILERWGDSNYKPSYYQ